MKKFYVLSGAKKNAGDYLITNRCVELLKEVYPECEIKIKGRDGLLDNYIDEMNTFDSIIFAGGPMYTEDMYPKGIPFVTDLNSIKTKISEIGLGWWGKTYDVSSLDDFEFQLQMKKLLLRIQSDERILSGRDFFSTYILQNNGFNSVMTGCPAWYAPENKQKCVISQEIKKICISDSVWYKNHDQILEVVKYIKKKFKRAEIMFVFHRGIDRDVNTCEEVALKNIELKNELEKLDINIKNIAYGHKGFELYDNCDLHIGYRVHAHIYNLSIHNPSILIQEDSRGAGVNQALGLFGLNARINGFYGEINKSIINELENVINIYLSEEFYSYKSVFEKIRITKESMIEHIKRIC